MAERLIIDQLDDAVAEILAGRAPDLTNSDPVVAMLAEMAVDLRGLPTEAFRAQLRQQLGRREEMSSPAQERKAQTVRGLWAHLVFSNASAAMDFYKKAFGATETMRLTEPGGKIGHAEMKIGEATISLSDEYPDYGSLSPQTIGGSPIKLHLEVVDVDEFARVAVAAGATITRPIQDQFYGDRAGQLLDPFGYTWAISTHIKDVPVDELQQKVEEWATQEAEKKSKKGRREGFHSVTPYLTVRKAPELVDFVKSAFGATELFRTTGSAGGLHCEVKIGESMVMIGGGEGIQEWPTAIHLYVPDVDAAYQRALDAGATSLATPTDQEYGERSAAVQDSTGNHWYIATTFTPLKEIDQDLHTVTVYFHPVGAARMIEFLDQAFGAKEVMRHQSDEGYIYHAKVRLGDSIVEMGEAHDQWQSMPTAIYLYVEDVDAVYEQALQAGAVSVVPPADQPYGDRNAWVKDPFENIWYIATTVA
ncbi:MAG TPA: VOC family protein [Pyrinomonadaceae bacterium]|nr:VOC family protein [Pyrinomonadaceae bacterium]